jgi:hypothetical protein
MSSELITSFEQKFKALEKKYKAFIKYLQSYESLSKQYTGEDEEQDGEKLKDQAVDSAKRKWEEIQNVVEEIQNVVSATFNSYQIKNESLNSPDATIGETKPNPLIDTETIDDSLASKEILEATSEAIYEPTPTEKKFVEYYNRILKVHESQSDMEDQIAKWTSDNGQELKRMSMLNIGNVLDVQSELPKLSEDQRGNFYGLREDDYYFVVPISGVDVTQNDSIKQVFEIQGSGKYLKEVIKPARFQVQVKQDNIQVQKEQDNVRVQEEQDNIITLCPGEKGKISLKDN